MARRKNPEIESLTRRIASLEAQHIDHLYGLEPVYEPAAQRAGVVAEQFVAATCPYCGERFEARVEVSAGAQEYIEDCEVCCRPMALSVEIEDNGALHALRVQRLD
ncbi:MAG TPA: CPXCG motif-containing cysteine-rich protein [Steroidobacteraceae bacterium]